MSKKNRFQWKNYVKALAVVLCLFAAFPFTEGCGTEQINKEAQAVLNTQNEDAQKVETYNEGAQTEDTQKKDTYNESAQNEGAQNEDTYNDDVYNEQNTGQTFELSDIPAYAGQPYISVNDNTPFFTEDELSSTSYETYGELDYLGRCTTCVASVGVDLMPAEERGNIGSIKPTGWHTVKYDFVDGKYLYNRCHLIGYQLTGENANEKNLITGTRYLNIEGMLPFENMVADYVKETKNHVMYRVTPVFDGENLLAAGVLMEGKSVEDNGDGVLFCVFAYNVQPGVTIDYATGESYEDGTEGVTAEPEVAASQVTDNAAAELSEEQTYILNTNTQKFHKPDCKSVETIKPQNYAEFTGAREELLAAGYEPCKNCNP